MKKRIYVPSIDGIPGFMPGELTIPPFKAVEYPNAIPPNKKGGWHEKIKNLPKHERQKKSRKGSKKVGIRPNFQSGISKGGSAFFSFLLHSMGISINSSQIYM